MEVNKAQAEAIDFHDGACYVLAGPGSGKTTIITHRTKNLIEKYGVNPENILVITFTKSAALEMKERFNRITEGSYKTVTFGTFHAVYFKILGYAYNYRAENILREELKYNIIREIVEEMELEIDDESEFIGGIISEISNVKSEMMSPEHYYSKNCAEGIFRKIYKKYNDRLIRNNLIDFDDMLVMCYELLSQRPDILKMWQDKYRYILIDEFQDINKVQYEVVKLLAKPRNNLFVVGDDDQSIYSFRGARPDIMLGFPKDYKGAKKIVLDINYRCSQAIVRKASKLISNNKNRFEKNISTVNPRGEAISVCGYKNVTEECLSILGIIDRQIKAGGKLKDIAVLYRTNTIPRVLVEKLMEYNVPFKMKDALPNIYEHFIAKNILAYINIAMGSRERADFLQIINRPKRYISRQAFKEAKVNLNNLKGEYSDKEYVLERIFKLEYDLRMLSKMNPYAAINYIRNAIGYDKYIEEYAEYRRIKPEELYEILNELSESAKQYKTYEEWFKHIEEYGEELKKQAKQRTEQKDAVELSTMHGAKGLEYDTVIIMEANEGITPHKKSVLPADVEEERRMFYVAMTRARKKLYIFWCKERYGKDMEPSRFYNEIREQ